MIGRSIVTRSRSALRGVNRSAHRRMIPEVRRVRLGGVARDSMTEFGLNLLDKAPAAP